MIAPTFHSSILKSFMPVFNKNANNLVKQFKNHEGNIFDCHDYLSSATVDTLLGKFLNFYNVTFIYYLKKNHVRVYLKSSEAIRSSQIPCVIFLVE